MSDNTESVVLQKEQVDLDKINSDPDFLKKLSEECNQIFEEGFQISEKFASNEFQKVGREAAEALADILEQIESSTKPNGISQRVGQRVMRLLPNRLQDVISDTKKKNTATSIENKSVSETTKSIFNSLQKQSENLKDQLNFILQMDDNISFMIGRLEGQYEILEKSFIEKSNNGDFEENRRNEFRYKDLMNNVATHIKSFERQQRDIYQASIACEQTLNTIQENIPHLRQTLINSLSTNAFIQSIHEIQTNVNSLIHTTGEISISNSQKNKEVLVQVTDTTRYRSQQIENLQKQEAIESETRKQVKENFDRNLRYVEEHNQTLVSMDKEREKEKQVGLIDKAGRKHHRVVDFSTVQKISHETKEK